MNMNKREFLQGRTRIPVPLRADAYTIAGQAFAGEDAKSKSIYNFTNRYSPTENFGDVAHDDRMILFGVVQYIRNQLTDPCTPMDVVNTEAFMKTAHSFGGALNFDVQLWKDVVNKYDGFLPIKIEALPEGSTFFPNEPVIQVTSLADGYGEIAAHIEAIMLGMVSIATARATLTRHWYERIKKWVEKDYRFDDDEVVEIAARFMIHDFGMRSSSCAEESEMLGLAHLLTFHGTDTFNSAYLARKLGAEAPTGTSIDALAHRIVQGHDSETDAFNRLEEVSGNKVGSYVADCYNFENAVVNNLVKMAKADGTSTYVVRPDSGSPIANVLFICERALDAGLVNFCGRVIGGLNGCEASNLRFIQGDSVNPDLMFRTFESMEMNGFAPTKWGIFGVGGYLRNSSTRDALSSAYKLCAKGQDDEPVCKTVSEGSTKQSVPGDTIIDRSNIRPSVFLRGLGAVRNNERVVYYDASLVNEDGDQFCDPCFEDFKLTQQRNIEQFDKYINHDKNLDINQYDNNVLSKHVIRLQQEIQERHS